MFASFLEYKLRKTSEQTVISYTKTKSDDGNGT